MAEYINKASALRPFVIDKNGHLIRETDIDNWLVDISIRQVKQILREIPAADVVSRATFEQVMWERDIAIQQLKDLGVGFGEKADVAPVVRCKDCKYRSGLVGKAPFMVYICTHDKGLSGEIRKTDFCSYRERRSE